VRFRVQGRLNRWRRTKNITGQKGYLDLYSYNSRIEFGRAQAITRKGTQGIRIWICYNQKFSVILKKAIFNYRILNSIKQK
jgi:ribosomal protein S3